jgi:hypothetical protein
MQEMTWLSNLGNIDLSLEMVNKFCWHLEVSEQDGVWFVKSGQDEKHLIFKADTREAVDAFLYGMGLAYEGIPDPYHSELIEKLKQWQAEL